MAYAGKLVGAAVGFLFGGPVGALIGAGIGKGLLDDPKENREKQAKRQ